MKTFVKTITVLLCALSLLVFSCGGGGGGGGGGAVSMSTASDVAINFNGLYADTGATSSVWDTVDYVDLKILADNVEVFSKHLTAGDNTVLVEKLKTGSQVRAVGTLKFNEANGGGTGNIESETITLAKGENTLRVNVVYTYELLNEEGRVVASGTYTTASGIPVPEQEPGMLILTGWTDKNGNTYPPNLSGVRGNIVLNGEYTENRDYFILEIPEDWNGYLYLGTEDDDGYNGANYHAAGWLPVYGVNHASELHYEKISGDAEINVEFSDENEGVVLYVKAVNMGSARYRITKGNYYVDFDVNVDAMTYLEGDFDHGNVTLSHFLVPAGAPATATFTYYVGNANWHFTITPDAASGDVRSRIRRINMYNAHIDSIPDCLFENCNNLTHVEFPDGTEASEWNGGNPVTEFTSIGESAFANTNILEVVLDKCTHLTSIGENAFANCTNLNYVRLPASLQSIGPNAFAGCSGLENLPVLFAGTLAQWNAIGDGGNGWGGLEDPNLNVSVYFFGEAGNPTAFYSNGTWMY